MPPDFSNITSTSYATGTHTYTTTKDGYYATHTKGGSAEMSTSTYIMHVDGTVLGIDVCPQTTWANAHSGWIFLKAGVTVNISFSFSSGDGAGSLLLYAPPFSI